MASGWLVVRVEVEAMGEVGAVSGSKWEGPDEKAGSAQLRPEQGPVIELGRSFDFRSSTEPPTQAHNLIISALIIRYNLFNYPPVEDLIVRFIRDCNRVYPLLCLSSPACPSHCNGSQANKIRPISSGGSKVGKEKGPESIRS